MYIGRLIVVNFIMLLVVLFSFLLKVQASEKCGDLLVEKPYSDIISSEKALIEEAILGVGVKPTNRVKMDFRKMPGAYGLRLRDLLLAERMNGKPVLSSVKFNRAIHNMLISNPSIQIGNIHLSYVVRVSYEVPFFIDRDHEIFYVWIHDTGTGKTAYLLETEVEL